MVCFGCRLDAETTQRHHVVPVALGGVGAVMLCDNCHDKVHGMDSEGRGGLSLSLLTRIGVARARASGKHCGRPRKVFPAERALDALKQTSGRIAPAARLSGIPRSTLQRWLAEPTRKRGGKRAEGIIVEEA
jgi:hypothetical protein